MPSQDRVRGYDRRHLPEHLPARDLALHGQAPPLIVGEANPFALELALQDPILFLMYRSRRAAADYR